MDEIVVVDRPTSSFSEEIKRVRTNLKFSSINEDMKVVMITSSLPGEGKSFVSANLAAAFAQAEEKVLLIDCDLRKGRIKKIFNIPSKKSGLSNLLIDKKWKEKYYEYIRKTKIDNLYVITTGSYPPNPSELLASERFEKLLEKLKESFDIIILDCPPVTGLNDALVVSSRADVSVIVARYKKTKMEILEKTKKSIENIGSKIAGVILNQCAVRENNYYYYGHYYQSDESAEKSSSTVKNTNVKEKTSAKDKKEGKSSERHS